MDRDLEHRLQPIQNRINYRKAVIKNYQDFLISGRLSNKLTLETISNIKKIKNEIKEFEKQIAAKTKSHRKQKKKNDRENTENQKTIQAQSKKKG